MANLPSEVTVELTDDDHVAWNLFHTRTDPRIRAVQRTTRLVSALLVVVLLGGALSMSNLLAPVLRWAFVTLFALVVWLVHPWATARMTGGTLGRMARGGGLGATGSARIVAEPEGLREYLPGRTSGCEWNQVQAVHSTPEHVFIVVGPGAALVVPKRHQPDTVDAFAALVAERSGVPLR